MLVSSIRYGAVVPASEKLRVSVKHGVLVEVVAKSPAGLVTGKLEDGTWVADSPLIPGVSYHVQAAVRPLHGSTRAVDRSFRFSTVGSSTRLSIDVTPNDTAVVGIAQPVALLFNVSVANRQAVTEALHVTTTPAKEGAWRWVSDREVRWRPRDYWAPGTVVSVDGDLRGFDLGSGVYAAGLISQSFKVGRSQELRVDARTKMAAFYQDGKIVRNIPVSLGKLGFETRSGVKVVLERYRVKRMRSDQPGESYDLQVPYAIRLTRTGEFLHAAPWAASRLGRVNGSHGCTNVSLEDGRWLYSRLQQGDPVVTTGTSRKMTLENGYGDWSLDWAAWQSRSSTNTQS